MVRKTHGGSCRNRHRMRCSQGVKGCGRRFTLRRPPAAYKNPIKCPHCKSTTVVSVEKARREEQNKKDLCSCDGYPFLHERGSLRMCDAHPNISLEPTNEEIEDYEACVATPRGNFT